MQIEIMNFQLLLLSLQHSQELVIFQLEKVPIFPLFRVLQKSRYAQPREG